jgi:hypothetical protein
MSQKKKILSLKCFMAVVITIAAVGIATAVGSVLRIRYKEGAVHPLDRKYTKQQWMEMFTKREHQMMTYWEGLPEGTIKESSASMSGPNLRYEGAQNPLLEHQLDSLLEQDPLMFVPLFDSKDPEVIITGIYAYRRYLPGDLSEDGQASIEAAFRKLLDHRDTRMRWAAVQTLGENRWLTVMDVERGLNDETAAVRYTTAFWMGTLVEKEPRYSEGGKLVELDPNDVRQLVETKRRLAPILVDHLNDPHFYVRHFMGLRFRNLFKRLVKIGSRTRDLEAPTLPEKFDWIRESWHTRDKTRKQWKTWWSEHGEEALRWAHPAQ